MPTPKYDQSWYERLTRKYTPLLVLYPEIPRDSIRVVTPDWQTFGCPPLTYDYHPRDIRLVLENAAILGDPDGEPGNSSVSPAPGAITTRRPQWSNPFLWVDEKCMDDPDYPTWLLR